MQQLVLVVGLGNMGGALAGRVRDSVPVMGIEVDRSRREQLEATAGFPVLGGLEDAPWDRVTRMLVVVRSSEDALHVMDVADANVEGSIASHLHTTLDPEQAQGLARRTWDHLRVLEQPISGGAGGAARGELTVMSAGPATEEDTAFLMASIASRIVEFGSYGEPTLAKLVNNAAATYNVKVASLLLDLGESLGLEADKLHEVIRNGSGGSWMGSSLEQIGEDQVRLLAKDIRLLQSRSGQLPSIAADDEEGLVEAVARAQQLTGPSSRG